MKHLKSLFSIILTVICLSSLTIAQDTTLTVTANGNVGIGTSNPEQKLHVKGLARFDLGTGQINISTPGGAPGIISFASNGHRRDVILDDLGIRILVSPTSAAAGSNNGIMVNEDGKVGIGNSYPSEKLDVAGNAHIAGKITSGDAKVSLPIAYGVINADGSIYSATSNVSCSWNSTNSRYELGFSGESYFIRDFVTTVQTVGDDLIFTSTNSLSGKLLVKLFDTSGSNIQNTFNFVVYKP